jgi:hypothetical protein
VQRVRHRLDPDLRTGQGRRAHRLADTQVRHPLLMLNSLIDAES